MTESEELQQAIAVLKKHGIRTYTENSNITQRVKVGQLIAEGYANKNIADKLGIAETTVKVHVKRLFLDHGCSNRVQLALVLKGYTPESLNNGS